MNPKNKTLIAVALSLMVGTLLVFGQAGVGPFGKKYNDFKNTYVDFGSGPSHGTIVSDSPLGGVGYATGAGGAVTQLTNRATGVTMVPNPCMSGTITTVNSSLAAEGSADFIVTDSAVRIGDTVVVSIQSGSNGGGTIVSVAIVTNGTFTIRVHNGNVASGTAETGVILINFAIIKAVSA